MKTQVTRHNRIGSLLLVLYLMILAVGVVHTHECEEHASMCQDCAEHIKHDAHISKAFIMDFDCVLCKIFYTDYLIPEVQTFSAAVLLFITKATCTVPNILRRTVVLPGLRAPPVMNLY